MLYHACVWRLSLAVNVQNYEMFKSGPLSAWFHPITWEWNLTTSLSTRTSVGWCNVTASYREERDN
jgi:hypothetical protein